MHDVKIPQTNVKFCDGTAACNSINDISKVKVKATKAQRWSRGVALLFL